MSDQQNPAGTQPADDIEAAAAAAAETAAASPEPPRPDAPPPAPAKPPEEPKPAAKKKAKSRKAARKKDAQPDGPAKAQEAAAARKANAPKPPEAPEPDPDVVEAEAKRVEAVTEMAERLIELTMRPLEEDETEEDRAQELDDVKAELVKTCKRGDTQELAAHCLAQADEAQQAVVKLRKLHGELVTLAPPDDGRSHNERLKEVHARSAEIRAQRAKDRLELLARGAGKSKLDQHLANRPRTSPADADAQPKPAE